MSTFLKTFLVCSMLTTCFGGVELQDEMNITRNQEPSAKEQMCISLSDLFTAWGTDPNFTLWKKPIKKTQIQAN